MSPQTGTALVLALALASTTLTNVAYLRQHDAAAALPALSLRRPLHSAEALLTDRSWLFGFALESAGFALYVVVLALAPLALVQSIAAGGIGILALASARLARRPTTTASVCRSRCVPRRPRVPPRLPASRAVLRSSQVRHAGLEQGNRAAGRDGSCPQGGRAPDQANGGRQTGVACTPGRFIAKVRRRPDARRVTSGTDDTTLATALTDRHAESHGRLNGSGDLASVASGE